MVTSSIALRVGVWAYPTSPFARECLECYPRALRRTSRRIGEGHRERLIVLVLETSGSVDARY
jgi:hypothetical protein